MSDSRFLTPPQIAARYGIKPEKVLRWIANGELVAVNIAERSTGRPRWRVSEEALQAFERRRSSRPEPKPTRKSRLEVPRYV